MSMQLPKILKNFGVYVDGVGLVGKCESCKLPSVTLKTEEIRTGGLDGPVKQDMGIEAMEFSFTLLEYTGGFDAFGGAVDRAQFTFKGFAQSATGEDMAVIVQMRGRVDVIDPAEAKAGQANGITFTASLVYLKYDGLEIDILNGKRNGVSVSGGSI